MDFSAENTPENPITTLTPDESWELLGSGELGRLIINASGRIEVFPVNYVTHQDKIVFRTAEGSKLVALLVYPDVVFEADHVADDSAWSVIVHGTAERIHQYQEIAKADELPLRSWVPTHKYNYVEITPGEITGRQMLLVRKD